MAGRRAPLIGGKPWEQIGRSPSSERAYMAHQALVAMSRGFRLQVFVAGEGDPRVGVVRRVANDYPSQTGVENGGSTLSLTFQDGRTIPLERVVRLARAGD